MQHRLLSDALDNYENPNDHYSPSFEVKFGSKLNPDGFSTNMDYFERSFITSGAVFGAGLVSFIVFVFAIFLRCAFTACRCLPRRPKGIHVEDPRNQFVVEHDDDSQHSEHVQEHHVEDGEVRQSEAPDPNKKYPWTCCRIFNMLILLLLALVALGCDQYVLIGRWKITKGINTAQSAVDDFQSIISSAVNYTDVLSNYGDTLSTELDAAESSCVIFSLDSSISDTIDDAIDTYESTMQSISDALSPINSKVDTYQAKMDLYASGAAFFILWALGLISVFLIVFFSCLQKRREAMASLWCSSFTYLVFIILGFIWMLVTIVLSDLCMNPVYNILDSVPLSGSAFNQIVYYATCTGNSSVGENLRTATGYVNLFNTEINEALTYCPNNADLLDMQATVQQINNTLPALYNLTACEPIQDILFNLINDAICTETYQGIFYIWGSQLLTSFFLFLLMVTASITYQYFLPLSEMLPPKPQRVQVERRRNPYTDDDEDVFLQARSTVLNGDDYDLEDVEEEGRIAGLAPSAPPPDRF